MSIFVCSFNKNYGRVIVEQTQYFDIHYHLNKEDIVNCVSFATKMRTARLIRISQVEELDQGEPLRFIHHFLRVLFLDLNNVKEAYAVYGEPPKGSDSWVSSGPKIGFFVRTDQYMVVQNFTNETPRIAVYPATAPLDLEFSRGYHLVTARRNVCSDWRVLFFIIGSPKARDGEMEYIVDSYDVCGLIDARCDIDLSALSHHLNDLVLSSGDIL